MILKNLAPMRWCPWESYLFVEHDRVDYRRLLEFSLFVMVIFLYPDVLEEENSRVSFKVKYGAVFFLSLKQVSKQFQ